MTAFVLRWIGVLCVIGGSTSVGFQYAADKRRRLEELKYARKVLSLFRGEIQYHHASLPEAFLALGNHVKEPYAEFLTCFGRTLEERRGQPFLDLYEDVMEKTLKKKTSLNGHDLERLSMFAGQLGYLDVKSQIAQTDYFMEQISHTIEEEEENYKKNGRLYRCLGVMGGLIISLILV